MRIRSNLPNFGPGDPLYEYIQSIERLAEYAAREMYDVKKYADSRNVKIANWCKTAIMCAELDPIDQPELYSEYHDILVRKMYTQYGYAVEEYVNIAIGNGELSPPQGYAITLQETHGGTRPDFVIRQNDSSGKSTMIAWLDLTSSRSAGHIWQKSGNGWRNMPVVAELYYSPLSLNNVSMAGDHSIAARAHLNSAIRRQEVGQRRLIEHMVNCTNKALGTLCEVLDSTGNSQQVNPQQMKPQQMKPQQVKSQHETRAAIAVLFERMFQHDLMSIHNRQQIVKGILVEYMTSPNNYYHDRARFLLLTVYAEIHSKKSDAMRYVRDSMMVSSPYVTGGAYERCLAE